MINYDRKRLGGSIEKVANRLDLGWPMKSGPKT